MRIAAARGGLRALALAALSAGVFAGTASAHVTIAPTSSRPADLQRYHLLVPNESEDGKSVVEVDMQLPLGITFALVDYQLPWQAKLVRRNGEIREIRWTRGVIPPDGYGELSFIARNPVREGQAPFKILQRYTGGHVARWIGTKDSDNPAAYVDLSETAIPQDIVSVHGEKLPTASAAPAAGAKAADKDDDDDAPSKGLVVVALVLGALGLLAGGLGLMASRRRPAA